MCVFRVLQCLAPANHLLLPLSLLPLPPFISIHSACTAANHTTNIMMKLLLATVLVAAVSGCTHEVHGKVNSDAVITKMPGQGQTLDEQRVCAKTCGKFGQHKCTCWAPKPESHGKCVTTSDFDERVEKHEKKVAAKAAAEDKAAAGKAAENASYQAGKAMEKKVKQQLNAHSFKALRGMMGGKCDQDSVDPCKGKAKGTVTPNGCCNNSSGPTCGLFDKHSQFCNNHK